MSVPQRYGGLRFLGLLLIIWGLVVIIVGLLAGLWLLLGNLWPGYNQGFNLVGIGPIGLAVCNGLPFLVAGATLRLLTDVEHQSRVAIQSADQSRKASEAAVKNSEMLIKSSETVMRNTEVAVKNTESSLKATTDAAVAMAALAAAPIVVASDTGDAARGVSGQIIDTTTSSIGSGGRIVLDTSTEVN